METGIISRDLYLNKVAPFIGKPVVKVITGMRRVGKSGVLELFRQYLRSNKTAKKNIVLINKESLEFSFIETYKDLYKYVIKKFKGVKGSKYLIVDEIQDIEEWEKAVTSLLADKQCDIYISGSNATMLSSELATRLTGRYIEIPVYSLSFKEYLRFSGIKSETYPEKAFDDYLRYGGLPGIHAFSHEDTVLYSYLNSVLDSILYKDLVKRHKIRDISLLERTVAFVFDNVGNLTTAKGISDFLKSQRSKANIVTIQGHCTAMEHAYLIHRLRRFDLKGKRHLEYAEKFFLGDVGIRYGLIGFADHDINGILENIVALELLRRGYQLSVGFIGGLEIDFVAKKQGETLYVQVCQRLSGGKTINREFGNLSLINDNYPKIVLSLEKHFPSDQNGIRHAYLPDFLLGK